MNTREYYSRKAGIPVEYPDELYHYKYIDKIFKNGKWQYIYNKASTLGRRIKNDAKFYYKLHLSRKIKKAKKAAGDTYNKAKDVWDRKITGETYKKQAQNYHDQQKILNRGAGHGGDPGNYKERIRQMPDAHVYRPTSRETNRYMHDVNRAKKGQEVAEKQYNNSLVGKVQNTTYALAKKMGLAKKSESEFEKEKYGYTDGVKAGSTAPHTQNRKDDKTQNRPTGSSSPRPTTSKPSLTNPNIAKPNSMPNNTAPYLNRPNPNSLNTLLQPKTSVRGDRPDRTRRTDVPNHERGNGNRGSNKKRKTSHKHNRITR